MLKAKGLTSIIVTASILVALILAAVGVTFAWYSTHVSVDKNLEFIADGVLVVYFDGEPTFEDQMLKPAVAKKGEITNNTTDFGDLFDVNNVLLEGGSSGAGQVATSVTTSVTLAYRNSSSAQAENNNTATPADVYFSVAAKLKLGENEKPLEIDYSSSSRDHELTVLLDSVEVSYVYTPVSNVTYDSAHGNAKAFDEIIHVTGDCDVTVTMTIYFSQVDDLIDPQILDTIYDNNSSLIVIVHGTIDGEDE